MEITNAPRVNIVLSPDNASWIIEKMAKRLAEHAERFGMTCSVTSQPDPTASLNHWMSYAFANVVRSTPTTVGITHLDDPYKIGMVARLLKDQADLGICLSSSHRAFLVEQGIPAERLTFVVPGHDFAAPPRRIVIGLTTRIYSDGRKREAMLVNLARKMTLDAFRFDIFGSGWEPTIEKLRAAGAEVRYFPGTDDYVGDYNDIMAALPFFDYYLYLGRDEGSLGTLDALSAGVKTIVTPQGFHCDLPNGITHSVWDDADLLHVFAEIAAEKKLLSEAVSGFSWTAYADQHCHIWRCVLEGRSIDSVQPVGQTAARDESAWSLRLRYLKPRRIVSALSHIPILKPVRRWLLKRRR
ncbi:MAG: hypothetical protein JST65_24400 [Acidobacteria bacterium]|nr:hypothetical protein [Acidobacteriota bacterium]